MYLKNNRFHTAEDLLNIEAGKEDINKTSNIYVSDAESSENLNDPKESHININSNNSVDINLDTNYEERDIDEE